MLFFLFIFVVVVIGNSYLTIRVLQNFSDLPLGGTIAVWVVMFLPILLFIVSFFLVLGKYELPYTLMRVSYLVGASWLFFLLYAVIGLLLVDIVKIWIPIPAYSTFFIIVAVVVILGFGYRNYLNPQINSVNIELNKECTDKQIKVVAISDVHLGYGTSKKQLEGYLKMINQEQPDLILIGGDLIDNSVIPLYQERMMETLSQLSAPLGVYMVSGNHEHISGILECKNFLSRTGIKLLRDSIVSLPNGIQIVGRDDRFNMKRLSLEDLMKRVDLQKPVILLDHQPYELELAEQLGVDVQFSGHTHRGQIWPISLVTDLMYAQSYGYRQWSRSHIYVSSGLSLWGPPFRVGTDSEMVVMNIGFSK